MLEEATSPCLSPALEKMSQNGTISPSLPLLFPPRESRRSPALLRQTRCRRSAAFFFLLLFHRRFAAPCRSDVVRRLARSKPHGRHRLLSLPPSLPPSASPARRHCRRCLPIPTPLTRPGQSQGEREREHAAFGLPAGAREPPPLLRPPNPLLMLASRLRGGGRRDRGVSAAPPT